MDKKYCTNCGTKLDLKSKFCGKCGLSTNSSLSPTKIKNQSVQKEKYIVLAKPEEKSSKDQAPKKGVTVWRVIYVIVWICVIRLISIYAGFLWFLVLLCVIAFWLGGKLAARYIKKGKIGRRSAIFLSWLNVIAWLIPVIGIFFSGFTFRLSTADTRRKTLYTVLGTIGLVGAIINMGIGIGLQIYFSNADKDQKAYIESLYDQVTTCQSDVEKRRSSVNEYDSGAVDTFNTTVKACNDLRDKYFQNGGK